MELMMMIKLFGADAATLEGKQAAVDVDVEEFRV